MSSLLSIYKRKPYFITDRLTNSKCYCQNGKEESSGIESKKKGQGSKYGVKHRGSEGSLGALESQLKTGNQRFLTGFFHALLGAYAKCIKMSR